MNRLTFPANNPTVRDALRWLSLDLSIAPLTSLLKHQVTHVIMQPDGPRAIRYGYVMLNDVAAASMERQRERVTESLRRGWRAQADVHMTELLVEVAR